MLNICGDTELDNAVQGFTQVTPSFSNSLAKAKSLVNETTALRLSTNGLEFEKPARLSRLLYIVDLVMTFLCIGPLVSIYWYSTWELGDYYLFSSNLEASYWTSFTLGCTMIALATLMQDRILTFSTNRCKPVRYILMRLFTYIMSVAGVNQWRGVWDLEDYYTGISSINAVLTYCLTTVVLICLRGHRSVLCPPATVYVDIKHAEHYKLATFWTVPTGATFKFVLDTMCTAFVIEPLTISVWRGLWELVDCELYPNDVKMRIVVCMVGCYGLALFVSLLQVPTQRLCAYLENVNWYLMLAFENLITALYVVISVINWRGFWLVFEEYAPSNVEYIWLYHYLSFGILAVALAANSTMIQVSPMDGSLPNGRGVILEPSYVAVILSVWRFKKEAASLFP